MGRAPRPPLPLRGTMTVELLLALAAGALGMGLIACAWGPIICTARRRHKWGAWYQRGLINNERMCRTCGTRQHRESEQWQRITAPATYVSDPLPADTSQPAPTVEVRYPWLTSGRTVEVPRPPNGEPSSTPPPPKAEAPGRAALDHEPSSRLDSSSPEAGTASLPATC
jgi:hypothetical protein